MYQSTVSQLQNVSNKNVFHADSSTGTIMDEFNLKVLKFVFFLEIKVLVYLELPGAFPRPISIEVSPDVKGYSIVVC